MSGPRVEIVIDELVVRGLAPEAARLAAAALESRLASLAQEGAAGVSTREDSCLRAPAIDVPPGSPGALGDAVAGAVWRELSTAGPGPLTVVTNNPQAGGAR